MRVCSRKTRSQTRRFGPGSSRRSLLLVAALTTACGESGREGGGSASSSTDTLDSGVPDCPDVYDGHLYITDEFDVESLRFTGRVTSDLSIQGTNFVDLEFLGCLHHVGGKLRIGGNDRLTTLAGLEQLETLGDPDALGARNSVGLSNNAALETLEHLESLTRIWALTVDGNPALTDLGLDNLEFLQLLQLGAMCGTAELNNAALVEVRGLASLEELRNLEIGQQLELTSLGVLHDVVQRSDPPFPTTMWFWENPELPYAEIETLLDEAGVSDAFHCGSLDDPEPVCECPTPD